MINLCSLLLSRIKYCRPPWTRSAGVGLWPDSAHVWSWLGLCPARWGLCGSGSAAFEVPAVWTLGYEFPSPDWLSSSLVLTHGHAALLKEQKKKKKCKAKVTKCWTLPNILIIKHFITKYLGSKSLVAPSVERIHWDSVLLWKSSSAGWVWLASPHGRPKGMSLASLEVFPLCPETGGDGQNPAVAMGKWKTRLVGEQCPCGVHWLKTDSIAREDEKY